MYEKKLEFWHRNQKKYFNKNYGLEIRICQLKLLSLQND